MPLEAIALLMQAVPLEQCPLCGASPFTPFMRGQVQRKRWTCREGLRSILCMRPFDYCALICADCKQVVGWERPEDLQALLEKYERHQICKRLAKEWRERT